MFERDVLCEAEVHDQHHDHDQHDAGAYGVRALKLDHRHAVLATPPAKAPHLLFPLALLLLLLLVFGFGFALTRPRLLSVAVGYFSPNRFSSRLVNSRLLATSLAGRLPISGEPTPEFSLGPSTP